MKITIAQLNPTIGDFDGNLMLLKNALKTAQSDQSDLIVFPELFINGYPPKDLLENKDFILKTQDTIKKLLTISQQFSRLGILVGAVTSKKQNDYKLYNSALLIYKGRIIGQQDKMLLPTYDVFDESRYFSPADKINVIPFKKEILGISICEDMWSIAGVKSKYYDVDPIKILVKQGATILINLSASPFNITKEEIRYNIIKKHATKHRLPFIYVNQIGGNDELIFDGESMVFNQSGDLVDLLPTFETKIKTINLDSIKHQKKKFVQKNVVETVYKALVLGVRDYARKCGFKTAILGLSGGIDSALTCCIAVEALGQKNVLGVTMPSMFSSKGSYEYSIKLAKNLGIEIKKIPITNIYHTYLNELKPHFKNKSFDITEENLQARIRGNLVMGLSNKLGHLLLSTGNKSEMAVGYCTLYGDMSGGLSVISDVPKTMVYKLAAYINKNKKIIPSAIIKVAPSAELRPNQKDQDTLPPYKILDAIIDLYVDQNRSVKEIIAKGFKPQTVNWVIRNINRTEYKRKQAATGLRITTKAFGVGRRMPIAAKYDFLIDN